MQTVRVPLRALFGAFWKIGCFTFGGGYAMIPIIRHEVTDRKQWIASDRFLELLTLAQSAPGPISLNTAVFVGYQLRGYAGALSALAGAVLPSFLIMLSLALFFSGIREVPLVEAAFKGMRPAVVALIIGPVLSLSRGLHPALWGVIVLTAFVIWHWNVSPVWLLAAAAAAGIAWALVVSPRIERRTK